MKGIFFLCLMTLSTTGFGQVSQEVILEDKSPSSQADSIMLEGKWVKIYKKKFDPTLRDVAYGPYERNKLDFWKAESQTPTPLVFYIHGGGWGGGSKEGNKGPHLNLLDNGISYVSINYRLARGENKLPCSLVDAARALQFVRSKAAEWNIDPDRIIATGGSAGGCSSLWLACHDDLANPNSEDPIERESTRLLAAAVISAQTTIDAMLIQERIGNSATSHGMIWKSVGANSPDELLNNWEKYKELALECSPLTHLSKEDPPMYLSYSYDSPEPVTRNGIHHAEFGRIFKEAADPIGVECLFEIQCPETRQKELEKFMLRTFNEAKKNSTITLFSSSCSNSSNKTDHSKEPKVSQQNDWEMIEADAIAEAENGWWKESMENHDERIQWWRDARFGCFIHWGVYANIAGIWKGNEYAGYAEHSQRYFQIDQETYLNDVIQEFNPVNFDADQWIRRIKEAGMKYFIITAKHHDGFAMFDSDVSDYNIIDQTPFNRDPMMELKEACAKYGIKFGFYYSQAFDWGEEYGAGNDWEYNRPGGDKKLYNDREWYIERPDLYKEIQEKYTNAKAIPQIKELIRKYDPDILWFDTSHKLPFWENLRMLKEIRKLSNNIVVNGRLARRVGQNYGDYINTGDRAAEFFSKDGDWEGIPTTNESYGYSKVDKSHKNPQFFIQLIAKAASRNGNLLMNIGPKADGTFDSIDVAILDGIGKWMSKYGQSIYGTNNSALPIQNWGVTTQKDNKLYLHVFDWPEDGKLVVGGLKSVPAKAYTLAQSDQTIDFKKENKLDLVLKVDNKAPDKNNSVIVLEINNPVEVDSSRLLEVNNSNRLLFFDAKIEGRNADKLQYADGKANRFYITNWTDTEQWFSWNVRVNEPAEYDLILHYYRDSLTGSVSVSLDGEPILKNINPLIHTTSRSEPCAKISIGQLKLTPGKHSIMIKPELQPAGEVMKPLEIELQPL